MKSILARTESNGIERERRKKVNEPPSWIRWQVQELSLYSNFIESGAPALFISKKEPKIEERELEELKGLCFTDWRTYLEHGEILRFKNILVFEMTNQ